MKTSNSLDVGEIYTRKQLREMFGIKDATINTGTFRPKGHDSVWLFVTENKTPDRTQYHDLLDNGVLSWDGQTQGRTDHWIIGHEDQGLELLLFYRKSKTESRTRTPTTSDLSRSSSATRRGPAPSPR